MAASYKPISNHLWLELCDVLHLPQTVTAADVVAKITELVAACEAAEDWINNANGPFALIDRLQAVLKAIKE